MNTITVQYFTIVLEYTITNLVFYIHFEEEDEHNRFS